MHSYDTTSRVMILDRKHPLLPANQDPTTLTPQQLGLFDAETGQSLGATSPKTSGFYFGLGVGSGNILQDIIQSPTFDANGITSILGDCFKPYATAIIAVNGFKVKCETNYSLQLVVHTLDSDAIQGFQPIRKSYPVLTSCCDDPCTCDNGNSCVDLAVRYGRAINADIDKLATAWLVNDADALTVGATRIDPNDQAAIDAFILANPTSCLGLQIEPNIEKVYTFCDIPYKSGQSWDFAGVAAYRVTVAIPTGHECMGTITVIQDVQYPGMTAADAALQEYFHQAYIGNDLGPYRVLDDGQPIQSNSIKQDKFSGLYSVLSISGRHTVHVGANDRSRFRDVQLLLPCGGGSPTVLTELGAALANQGIDGYVATDFTDIDACACK